MLLRKKTIALLALALVGTMCATTARAETSQRDQEEAAQRAYQASSQEFEDVVREAQRAEDTARAVLDAAIEAEKQLIERE